ncbi:MAG: hypothetical protein IIC26_05345 [Chloroflexi bacterium]|nr:hypothetical protein [Chloroflexota bacterium]
MPPETKIDHLVYAVKDVPRGIDEMEQLTGVRAVEGGRHRVAGAETRKRQRLSD